MNGNGKGAMTLAGTLGLLGLVASLTGSQISANGKQIREIETVNAAHRVAVEHRLTRIEEKLDQLARRLSKGR